VGRTSAGLYRFVGNRFETVIPLAYISRIEESADGHLLVISSQGFIELDGTRVVPHPGLSDQLDLHPGTIAHRVIIVSRLSGSQRHSFGSVPAKGLARRVNGSIERFQPYGSKAPGVHRIYEDPQGNLWVQSVTGMFRIAGAKLEPLAPTFRYGRKR